MRQLNDTLAILHGSGQTVLNKELMSNLGCIFEAHLPDLNELIKRQNAAVEEGKEERKETSIVMRPLNLNDTQKNSKVLSLFKNVDGKLPERLNLFSVFCLNNKKAINKLLQGKGSS